MSARATTFAAFAFGSLGVLATVTSASCSGGTEAEVTMLTPEQLADPESCRGCHASAVAEWEGSMHAYASDDPVFVAMNRRMRREAPSLAADTCTRCHAPSAARKGLLADADPAAVEKLARRDKGVTCIFCHTIDATTGTHGASVRTASDGVLRGGIREPAKGAPHGAAYSALHDREQLGSSATCGACHDVTTPKGDLLERTYAEWQGSLYSKEGPSGLACGKCHMDGRDAPAAATAGAPVRKVHDHGMPGIDLALTPFPHADVQRSRVQAALEAVVLSKLCVRPSPSGVDVELTLDNAFAGHEFPSGATHDRRVWVELEALDGATVLLTSGKIPADRAVFETASTDPNLWIFGDTLADESGKPVLFLWEGKTHAGTKLPYAVTSDPKDPRFVHSLTKVYRVPGLPTSVSAKVHVRAIDVDVLGELVRSGDLAADVVSKVPTLEIRTAARAWTKDLGFVCVGP